MVNLPPMPREGEREEVRNHYRWEDEGLWVSVQAGWGKYSAPRLNGYKLSDYEAVEVAMGYDDQEELLHPSDFGLGEELGEYWEDLSKGVGAYVPADLVWDTLIPHLKEKYGNPDQTPNEEAEIL